MSSRPEAMGIDGPADHLKTGSIAAVTGARVRGRRDFTRALLGVLCVGAGGCVTVKKQTPATQPIGLDRRIERRVRLVVGASLFAIEGDLERSERAARIHESAARVKRAAEDDLDFRDMRRVATDLILRRAGTSARGRAAAELIVDAAIEEIQELLGLDVDVVIVPADRAERLRALVIAAADAAMETSRPFIGIGNVG
jgi:hypothetical protein